MILGTYAGGQAPRTDYNQTDPAKADYLVGREKIAGHISDENNPHKSTAEQVDAVPTSRTVNGKALSSDIALSASDVNARPNTWTPTAAEVGARPNTWTPTIAEIGAAPSGYGLGQIGGELKDVTSFSELDSIIRNGWYFIRFPEPFYIDGVFTQFFCLEVCGETGEHIHQTIHVIGSNYKLHRKCDMGVWDAVEWENPPMQTGVEYRTTERYNGKPVFAKLVNFGTLPNNTTKEVAYCGDGTASPISLKAIFEDGNVVYGGTGKDLDLGKSYNLTLDCTKYNIRISTDYDFTTRSAYVLIKYTKD